MKHPILAVLAALALALTPATGDAANPALMVLCPSSTASIRPGQGIGPVSVGMTVQDAARTLGITFSPLGLSYNGRPADMLGHVIRITPTTPLQWQSASLPGLTLVTRGDRVIGVSISPGGDPEIASCRTDRGLHLGSTDDEARAMYGDPPSTAPAGAGALWLYNSAGLLLALSPFLFTLPRPGSAVGTITVFAPGGGCNVLDAQAHPANNGVVGHNPDCADFTPRP